MDGRGVRRGARRRSGTAVGAGHVGAASVVAAPSRSVLGLERRWWGTDGLMWRERWQGGTGVAGLGGVWWGSEECGKGLERWRGFWDCFREKPQVRILAASWAPDAGPLGGEPRTSPISVRLPRTASNRRGWPASLGN